MTTVYNIYSTGHFLEVYSNVNSAVINCGEVAGSVRYNGTNQNLEIYNGTSWQNFPITNIEVRLSDEAESLLYWARQKRAEELTIDELCNSNPALAKARANYDLIKRIVASETPIS